MKDPPGQFSKCLFTDPRRRNISILTLPGAGADPPDFVNGEAYLAFAGGGSSGGIYILPRII